MKTEIHKWHCYVDEIDDTHIHLMMKDETDEKENTTTMGAFPKELFNHIEDVRRGLYVDVQVFSDDTVIISPVILTEEQQAEAKKFSEEAYRVLSEAAALFREPENRERNLIMSEERKWMPIKTAPRDDSEFLVGAWIGEKLWNDDDNTFKWLGQPTFVFTVSHHENPHGPYVTRGWNHRNGAFGGDAEYWAKAPDAPELTEEVLIVKKPEVQDETTPSVHPTEDG